MTLSGADSLSLLDAVWRRMHPDDTACYRWCRTILQPPRRRADHGGEYQDRSMNRPAHYGGRYSSRYHSRPTGG